MVSCRATALATHQPGRELLPDERGGLSREAPEGALQPREVTAGLLRDDPQRLDLCLKKKREATHASEDV